MTRQGARPWVSGRKPSPGGTARRRHRAVHPPLRRRGRPRRGRQYLLPGQEAPGAPLGDLQRRQRRQPGPARLAAWLRGTIDELPDKALPPVRKFQTKPTANLTGTMAAFRPDGALGSGRFGPPRPAITSRGSPNKREQACRTAAADRARARRVRPRRRAEAAASRSGRNGRRAARRSQAGVTPMAQRVAVLGILNKRNGIVQNVALHPGQAVRWKDVIVRLRACETTAPWEEEKLTGAFVQVDVAAARQALAARLLGLALQGIAVAQRRRAPGLRRLAQELRDDISRPGRRRRPRRSPRATGRARRNRPARRARRSAPRPARRRAAPPPSAADSNAT